jgi:imidazolonepropionase-like amidohydrolase
MIKKRSRRDATLFARVVRPTSACILMLVALVLVGLQIARSRVSADAPDVYAITNAQIITGVGKTIAKGAIVFRRGLITDVGESVRIPADARVIDGTGLTVYPGLIDAYTSLGLPAPTPAPAQAGGARQAAVAAAASGQQPQPELVHGDPSISAADQVRPTGAGLEDARSAGITTALTSARQGIFAGQSALINLAGSDGANMVVRAPVALTVQFSTSSGFFGVYPNSLMGAVAFIRQTFYDAIHYRDELARFDRTKRGVNRPPYDKKLAALQPALRGELPVMFIASREGDVRRALQIADEFKLKPIIAGALYGARIAELLKGKNVPVILSVDFPRRPADLPEDQDEPLRVLRERAEAPKSAALLAQAGVKFAFTSGNLRPQDFIANVQKAIDSGLARDEALRALTINAAEILGVADQLGSIEVGKVANLVITSGDLFAKDAKIRYVFIDGKEIELKKPEAPTARPGSRMQQAEVDPSGDWELVVRAPQGDLKVQLSLRRSSGQIIGSLVGPMGSYEVRNATLAGNQLRFTVSFAMGADTVEAILNCTIEGDQMRGTVALSTFGTFDFTGRRPR